MWDSKIVNKNPSSSVTMRLQGVKFKKLTRSQKSQLEYFIQNHTTGEAQISHYDGGEPTLD
jgi:hypothetical protein